MKAAIPMLTLSILGCGVTDPKGPPKQLTQLPRELTVSETRVSRSANEFAFTLFRRLNEAQPDANVFVSPLSVSFALGMAMNGAASTTFDQMRSTLGFGPQELAEINAGYRGLLSLEGALDPSTTFQIANSVWYRQTFAFNQSFIDGVREAFQAEVRASPFDVATVKQVNDWVSAKTKGKIPTIVDAISSQDVMFLINAIYFKGSWRNQFDPAGTRDALFHSVGGDQTVKMMHRKDGAGTIGFATTTTATIGELTYGNGAFVMTLVVPNQNGSLATLAAGLDTATWASWLEPVREHDFAVSLPKLRLSYERELADDLKALGMQLPFVAGGADFTRMSPAGKDLFIAFVKHKTFVDVNEEGTEAAAVTNVGIGVTSLPPCLCVDRPFLFVIRERFSGTILFMGKIVKIPEG
ncbi:MAG TPA: serpin family protein [Gemmatimonadaceae bacterium]|nr:serpin family protein [Gemmatimonadaceae bacterium]